jgi:hypothetical protein
MFHGSKLRARGLARSVGSTDRFGPAGPGMVDRRSCYRWGARVALPISSDWRARRSASRVASRERSMLPDNAGPARVAVALAAQRRETLTSKRDGVLESGNQVMTSRPAFGDPLPTPKQQVMLCDMIQDAFIELRLLCGEGRSEQARDLADAFHNISTEMHGWGSFRWERFSRGLGSYQRRWRNDEDRWPDYVAMLIEVRRAV